MANIVGVRLDERLIHGQVATAWNYHYSAQRIMVIDNNIVKSQIEKAALKMACPSTVKLSILSIESAIKNLQSGKYGEERIFLVCKDLKYFLELANHGIQFDTVILGNLSKKDNSVQYRRSVFLTPENEQTIEAIISKGVRVTMQMTPADNEETYESAKARIGEKA